MLDYNPNWDKISISTGYLVVYCPDHPKAWSTGYVYVHRIIMENIIGRILQKNEIVHHKDKNKLNNSPDNLEITTAKQHGIKHSKLATIKKLVCDECGVTFYRRLGQNKEAKKYKHSFCSRKCSGTNTRRKQLYGSV